MAARAGGVVGGSFYAASSTYSALIPLPTIVATSDDTPANGSSLILTVINASPAGNSVFLTDGSSIVEQIVTDEYENEITVTVDRGPFKYGANVSLYVVDAEYLQGPNHTIQLTPQDGWAYVNLGTLADPEFRLEAVPDLASGDQVAWDTAGGIVFVRDDASFYATAAVESFDVEAWSAGEGWGDAGTQTLSVEIAADAIFTLASHELTTLEATQEGGQEPAFAPAALEVTPLTFIVTSGTEIPTDVSFSITPLEVTALEAAPATGQAFVLDITPHDVTPLSSFDESGHDLAADISALEVVSLPFSVSAGQPVDIVLALSAMQVAPIEAEVSAGRAPLFDITAVRATSLDAVTESGNDIDFVRTAIVIYPIEFNPEVRAADAVEQSFRRRYPEFADYNRWPYELVSDALCEARGEIGKRWGKYAECTLHQRGLFAFTAHWLVMREAARKTAMAGAIPSTPARVASKTVGGESVSYQIGQYTTYSAGDDVLASTVYGAEFLRLRKRAGMGAIAI